MQAACLTCGLGLIMCLFKIRSRTQGTTSFTFKSSGEKERWRGRREISESATLIFNFHVTCSSNETPVSLWVLRWHFNLYLFRKNFSVVSGKVFLVKETRNRVILTLHGSVAEPVAEEMYHSYCIWFSALLLHECVHACMLWLQNPGAKAQFGFYILSFVYTWDLRPLSQH